jgi:hypothetical protein
MVPSSLFLVWHFQQQVTPTLATQRHLRSPTPFLRQTKPKPQHARPKSLSAIAVFSTPATHTSTVPSTPQAPPAALAPTFKKTPTPNRRNYGNPKVQATITANLSCNQGSGGHALQQLELLDTHPLFTGRCPRCEMTYPQYETPPIHWDCSACGWIDDSV